MLLLFAKLYPLSSPNLDRVRSAEMGFFALGEIRTEIPDIILSDLKVGHASGKPVGEYHFLLLPLTISTNQQVRKSYSYAKHS
jgi:hypothetical protein